MNKLFNIKHNDDVCAVTITVFGINMSFRDYKKYAKKLRDVLNRVKRSKQKLIKQNDNLRQRYDHAITENEKLKNDTINNSFRKPNGINSTIESYKEYFLKNNMPEKIQKMKEGLDENSLKVLDYSFRKMLHLPDRTFRDFFRINLKKFADFLEADYEKLGAEICEKELENWKKQYKLSEDCYDVEVLYSHHGLKRANQKVLEYIKGKDFIDGGAYIGDSALVLQEYQPSKIYSFEMSEKNCENYIKTMDINEISPEKYELVKMGILDKKSELSIDDSGKNNTTLGSEGDSIVKTTDIDSYVFENNLNVGFIKTDVEGFGLPALNGMAKTIQTYRPVLSLAIYHCPEEFFEIKPRLQELVGDSYKIHIERDFPLFHAISGTVIFAYPKELEE